MLAARSSAHQEAPLPGRPVQLQMAWWDRLAIMGLGATGFASSYDALRQMALAIHTSAALSWLFPIFIDGFIAYGIRALMLMRNSNLDFRCSRRPGVITLCGGGLLGPMLAGRLGFRRLSAGLG